MSEKITVEQAFNNLANVIEGIRFLPGENNKIQQAMQIMSSVIATPPVKTEEEDKDGDKS